MKRNSWPRTSVTIPLEMQGQVHRFRLGSWHPRAIKALAVSQRVNADGPFYLAVGREDGEVEVNGFLRLQCTSDL